MKNILGLICFFLTFFTFNVFAQNQARLDSLQEVLKGELDVKEKVNTLNYIANEYGESDSTLVWEYTSKALELAEANNYKKGIADVFYHRGWLNMIRNNYEEATKLYKEMIVISEKIDYNQGISKAYQGLGIIETELGNYEKSINYHEKSLEIKKEIDDKDGIASSYNSIAIIYAMQGEYEQSLLYFTKMYDILVAINNKFGIARSLNNIGIIHEEMGNYPKSLEFYQKSLKIKEELNDRKGLSSAYNNIGMVHLAQENYKKAYTNYKKSLEIDKEVGSKRGIAEDLSNLGTISQNLGNYEEAREFFQQALALNEEIANKVGSASIMLFMGKLDIELKNFVEAQEHLESSLKIYQEVGQKRNIPETLVYLGTSYYEQQQYNKALKVLTEGIEMAKETGRAKSYQVGAEALAKTHEALGNYKKAYENHKVFKEMTDSLFNEGNTRRITQLSTQYTYEKQTDSLRMAQAQEKALLNAEIKHKETTQLATFIVLGLTVIIVIVLIVFYRSKQSNNTKLNLANIELKNYNEELTSANEKVNQANEEIKTINDSLNTSLETVEKQRDDILSSITYAQRIQNAILPTSDRLKKALPNHFILFKPRDVVSGDFYWFEEIGNKQFIVVADCTGHGVPGAFMTMLGTQALINIIIQKEIYTPHEILHRLDEALYKLLRNENKQVADGMDIVVCVYDKTTKSLEFSGAKNPLLLVQNKEYKEIKGDNHSINGQRREGKAFTFTSYATKIDAPTTLYLYTDGFQDQFGGKNNKKFMKKRWKEQLNELSTFPIDQQKEQLEKVLANWMGAYPQLDDILVMGIELS